MSFAKLTIDLLVLELITFLAAWFFTYNNVEGLALLNISWTVSFALLAAVFAYIAAFKGEW